MCRKAVGALKAELKGLKGVTDERLARTPKKCGDTLRSFTKITQPMSDDLIDRMAFCLGAAARCLCGDHSQCKQWAEEIATMHGKDEVVYFCKAINDDRKKGGVRYRRHDQVSWFVLCM